MNEESELGRLSLADNSTLVLTSIYVAQLQHRGIFGDSVELIPLRSVTTIRLNWRRSRVFLVLGVIALATFLFLTFSSMSAAPGGRQLAEQLINLSASSLALIQYGALLVAIGVLALFWLYKSHELQITTAAATVGGAPHGYEEARRFCSLLVTELAHQRPSSARIDSEPAAADEPTDGDWKL